MPEVLAALLEHIKDEWAVITGAPLLFFLAVMLAGTGLYFAIGAFYAERMETLKERASLFAERVADYKDKLSGASPAEAAKELAELRADLGTARAEIKMLVDWHRDHMADRRLSEEQKEKIAAKVREITAEDIGKVAISSVNQPEPQQYGFDIKEAFVRAGHAGIQHFPIPLLFLTSPDEVGVLIVVKDEENPPEFAKIILDALKSAGVDCALDRCESPPPHECTVMVSYKRPVAPA